MAENENHIALNQQELFLNSLKSVDNKQYQKEWKYQQVQQENHPLPSRQFEREMLKPENLATNRYASVPCNDFNRVTLHGKNYIHGNFIKGANGKKLAIATQGPLATTMNDFWEMVLQEKSPIIVMLCKCMEDKEMVPTEKCCLYWPTLIFHPIRTKSFIIHADLVQEIVYVIGGRTEKVIKTNIRIADRITKETVHKLDHFQYLDWKDQSIPASTHALMHLYKFYILPAIKKAGGPIVVHCSAGIGRTGVFVGAIFMLDLFLHNQLVSMPLVRPQN
uniref:Protein tyrosine phosphatase n=1 Tax=Panagrolaimus sp. ES5 TaxID=591445 RepID=A0AC34FGT4_9BILA